MLLDLPRLVLLAYSVVMLVAGCLLAKYEPTPRSRAWGYVAIVIGVVLGGLFVYAGPLTIINYVLIFMVLSVLLWVPGGLLMKNGRTPGFRAGGYAAKVSTAVLGGLFVYSAFWLPLIHYPDAYGSSYLAILPIPCAVLWVISEILKKNGRIREIRAWGYRVTRVAIAYTALLIVVVYWFLSLGE